jgi:hypothetical protein
MTLGMSDDLLVASADRANIDAPVKSVLLGKLARFVVRVLADR